MYTIGPWKTEAKPEVRNDNNLGFSIEFQNSEVPLSQFRFLTMMGWQEVMRHPDTGEALYNKPPPLNCTDEVRNAWDHELVSCYWHWYEAVAYEFTKFLSIGEDRS